MPQPPFDGLKERLLREGVAPRYVRRYLGELGDHVDDLARAECRKGLDASAAEDAALLQLGDTEHLARAMLDRPELKSLAARHPWAVFGVGPVVALAAVIALSILAYAGLLSIFRPFADMGSIVDTRPPAPSWLRGLIDAWNLTLIYAAPLAVAAGVLILGIRQRMAAVWVLGGAILIAAVGGFHDISIQWPAVPGEHGHLSFGYGLAWLRSGDAQHAGALRAVANVLAVAGVYLGWRRWNGVRRTISPIHP